MKISIIKNLETPNEVSNSFSFEYLKRLIQKEFHQMDTFTSLMNDDLTDEEYLEKAKTIYNIELEENEKDINIAKLVRENTKSRLENDMKSLKESLKERLYNLKKWSIESSKLTKERLAVENGVTDYCDSLLEKIYKKKDKKTK